MMAQSLGIMTSGELSKLEIWSPRTVCCYNVVGTGHYTGRSSISLGGMRLPSAGGVAAVLQRGTTRRMPSGENIRFLATSSWPCRFRKGCYQTPSGRAPGLGQIIAQ